jgi:ribosomal protein L11 methyltransferase
MTGHWIDVSVQKKFDAGELLSRLDDPTVQGAWEDEGAVHLYWASDQWNEERLALVRSVLSDLVPSTGEIPLSVTRVPNQDWNQVWAESVKPLWIGRHLLIRPSWETVAARPGQIEIILDPKQAFGTGHHATTRMLLEWLEEDIQGGEAVLDVGTGSGVLAMASIRLGAFLAVGIDHDSVAIECAREYAEVNRFGAELVLQCGELNERHEGRSFDLVLANLDRQTLLNLADRLARCTKSRLLVSGVLGDQADEIVSAFAAAGLYPGRRREQEGWLAMEFVRGEPCEGG